ncbi:hypothetical protein TSUD_234650 [Trifolium subterraneum]|uniref:Uncharacterized protein n=1 Tax=Trifolium subterraneum TaxID=3900 RepID=A0A2Z6LYL9_TRISU|nr:hypothetical protein TSUD_234650 [Trifolium subterraneum]
MVKLSNMATVKMIDQLAQEVRETCELALQRILNLKHDATNDDLTAPGISPFKSVDPAAPATSCSSVNQLRELLLDEEKGMYERYVTLFALRNDGGNETVAAIIDSLGSMSALLKHEPLDNQSVALLEEFTAEPEPLVSQSCQVALSMLEFERSGNHLSSYSCALQLYIKCFLW